jgi:hypothetical protein
MLDLGHIKIYVSFPLYKTIPAIVSTEASTIVKCRNGNNDDRNEPEIPYIFSILHFDMLDLGHIKKYVSFPPANSKVFI